MLFFLSFYSNGCIAVFISACTNVIQRRGDKKKYKILTVWTVEVTIVSTRTRRTQTIRDDIRPRAPAGLLSRNSCVVLAARAVAETLHG